MSAPPEGASSRGGGGPRSPHSPRDRIRRGNSPLTVLINPPSLDDDFAMQDPPCGGVGIDTVDSLSLAIEELRLTASVANPRISNATGVVAEFASADSRNNRNGSGGSSSGSSGGSSGSRSDDEFLTIRPAAKRSSSLKSKKTPPGTPSQTKKAVRFADAFGLDLAYVKHVLDPENPPVIPPQATQDLQLGDDEDDEEAGIPTSALQPQLPAAAATTDVPAGLNCDDKYERRRVLYAARPAFSQPGHSAGFNSRVMAQKAVLESAVFVPPAEIQGFVRVANLAFEKSVTVRATFDDWRSGAIETLATYVPGSGNGMTDQFAFSLTLPAHALQQPGAGRCAAFCIAYRAAGLTYWDNNFGENYTFDCVPATV